MDKHIPCNVDWEGYFKGKGFDDISTERYREYVFHNANIRIEQPQWLNVSASGGHRLIDGSGISHYIPSGWVHLFWEVEDNAFYFVR